MDTYGIEPFDAKDQRGNGIAVGFNFRGLSVFKSSQQVNFFRWESMICYDCDRRNVVITIKTRDAKKKIGFKCDSRASAMQLYRRLKEASRFFSPENVEGKSDVDKPPKFANPTFAKSTESMNSESTNPANNHTCQIRHLPSSMRPPRLFSLSLCGDSAKSSLNLSPQSFGGVSNASTPTNQTDRLHTPEVDGESTTPTPSHHGDFETEISDASATKRRIAITNMNPFEGESKEYSGEERPKSEISTGSNKAEQIEHKFDQISKEGENAPTGKEICNKESVVAIQVEEFRDDDEDRKERGQDSLSKLKSSLDFSSQESLAKYNSPFGDFTKSNLFRANNQNRLGVMNFEMSASTSSITIPTTGNTAAQIAQQLWAKEFASSSVVFQKETPIIRRPRLISKMRAFSHFSKLWG
ncbi:unnamed protein product [Rodentolepis nana]|uniref:FERM domain-containing protein n=1 Tax=Rodentolepis nana TaxID=102285 RepID=A0A0R3TV01_RODNA|nr:unnamed protein product [Rodentolepis nana]